MRARDAHVRNGVTLHGKFWSGAINAPRALRSKLESGTKPHADSLQRLTRALKISTPMLNVLREDLPWCDPVAITRGLVCCQLAERRSENVRGCTSSGRPFVSVVMFLAFAEGREAGRWWRVVGRVCWSQSASRGGTFCVCVLICDPLRIPCARRHGCQGYFGSGAGRCKQV